MSEKMGAGELAKLARLNSARTGGEWARPYVLCLDDEYAIGVEQGDEENSSFLLICDINEEPDNYADNADFIVAAANAMPRLLNHIATLQREADEAKAEIARLSEEARALREALVKAHEAAEISECRIAEVYDYIVKARDAVNGSAHLASGIVSRGSLSVLQDIFEWLQKAKYGLGGRTNVAGSIAELTRGALARAKGEAE